MNSYKKLKNSYLSTPQSRYKNLQLFIDDGIKTKQILRV